MSTNEWLRRAEQRKALKTQTVRERAMSARAAAAKIQQEMPDATVIVNCCTRDNIQVNDPVLAENALKSDKLKFKGKFQEANKVNKQGRMYTSQALEDSIKKIAEEGKTPLPVEERWHPPTDDECGWRPIRPTAEKVELNQKSMAEVSAQANEFHDLSAVKGSNSRYKEYDRLRLMEDAMVVYQVGRSEPKQYEMVDISIVSSGGCPIGPQGAVGPQGPQGVPGMTDEEYFRNKLFNAMKMPKEVSKKLASEDVRFARQYERETGESLCEWKEISAQDLATAAKKQKLEELKIQVMAQNPSYLGVPASTVYGSQCSGAGPQGCQGFVGQTVSGNSEQHNYSQQVAATPIRFHPDQITHHTIGDDRRVFSVNVDVKPEKAEEFIAKLKEMFKKKAREDKRWKNIEAQAAESETWFTPNGPNRGNIPNVIDVFADVAAEAYTQLTTKIDSMCNEVFLDTPSFTINTPTPEGVPGANNITITAPPVTLMADSMISGDYNVNIGGC